MPQPPPAPNAPRPPPPVAPPRQPAIVVEGGIGQAQVQLAVEPDPMELQLHVVVAVARGVEHHARRFVDLEQRANLEPGVRGQRCDQSAAQIVEIEIAPAVALRLPDEPAAVLQEGHGGAVLDPAGRPFLAHDHAGGAGLGVGGRELENVLPPVGAVEEQLGPVRRPRHAVDIVPDHGVVERLAAAHVDPGALLRRNVVDEQLDDRIRSARLGIGLDVILALNLRLVHLEVVVRDLFLVESVVGHPTVVGGPPHGGALAELFAVDPARRSVLDPVGLAAVGRDRDLAAVAVAQPQIAVAIERLALAVGRIGRIELPATLGRAAGRTPSAAAATTPGRGLGDADLGRRTRGDVVAIPLAVVRVVERPAVGVPRHGEGSQLHGAGDLLRHLQVLLIPGHRLQAILGGGRDLQQADDERRGETRATEDGRLIH